MSFKKYDGSVWQSITPKQLKGIPYSGTLPATLTGTKAGYLHKYKIYGNTEQASGTPTPENPIYPSECGERTGNLFDKDSANIVGGYLDSTGAIVDSGGYYRTSDYIKILNSDSYVIYLLGRFASSRRIMVAFYDESKTFLSFAQSRTFRNVEMSYAPEIPQNAFYIRFSYIGQNTPNTDVDVMLTEGSTPPSSYIPHGYKLPLLSGSTPVDIYLGESQTTRRIKKLVLTGEETNWNKASSTYAGCFYKSTVLSAVQMEMYCTHLPYIAVSDFEQGTITISGNKRVNLWFPQFTSSSTVTEFKRYLQQQYANGTPVTIWYVLATEETGTLNEPLRKIGDYADTIDSTQTTTQIPTTAGSTTISWDGSGLAPSQFDSIQEWVDIPTYTYTNGEWVADNSN